VHHGSSLHRLEDDVKKPLLFLGLVVVSGLSLAGWLGGGGEDAVAEPTLAFDRIWIDRLPTRPKDNFHVFVAVTQEPIGVFQAGSQWKGTYEIFSYEVRGDELRLAFLQTGDKEKAKVRAWRCKEAGMDYCLELTGASRGVRRYVSHRDWVIGAAGRPDQLRDRIESVVRAGIAWE
jgi:hypothetical protein